VGNQNTIFFWKLNFRPKSTILRIFTMTEASLNPKFEKVMKNTQNVPKTDDNHQEQ